MSDPLLMVRSQSVKSESRERDSATVGRDQIVSIARWGELEDRVKTLETWSGPGQIQALIDGQRAIRADLVKVHATLDRHERILTRLGKDVGTLKSDVATLKSDVGTLKSDVATLKSDVATLKSDVATLKTDMVEVKAGMAELLRRIPEPPSLT